MFPARQPTVSLGVKTLFDMLNGPWHERALWIYTAVVLAHWIEHLVQAYQVFGLHWHRADAKGAVGFWQPWLVSSEFLHFGYALFMLAGFLLLREGFLGRSRFWWNLALVIQAWHFVEHALLQLQALTGHFLFGAPTPTSVVQLWVPRVELHLFYNAIVFAPMVIAMVYHRYPPAHEPVARCGCSRRLAAIQ